ncbi:hypothetical protein OSB04_012811 [Centaurea solstitialis]|uniref:PGG domain-containing protein n=1 Tax=Centaurea solstitialis TaxID=347529 RepID=A0AA38WEX6_9ASTR|nr:hypothetical protein OSB04_012811 [Centaurea solstitialis]
MLTVDFRRGGWIHKNGVSTRPGYYPYPSHVNTSSYVSVKLSGTNDTNYLMWKAQMMCLVQSHDMVGFIDGTLKPRKPNVNSKKKANTILRRIILEADYYQEWKRSDSLVKGWIFGSLSQRVLVKVVGLDTSHDVWKKLETTMTNKINNNNIINGPNSNNVDNNTINKSTRSKDKAHYIELYRAIRSDDWAKAQEIFHTDKDALTAEIDFDGHCAIHLGNALHFAAMVDNAQAAKMLVEKNPCLLFTVDDETCLPIHRAILNNHKTSFEYLLDVSKEHIRLCETETYLSPFEGKIGASLITAVIDAGHFGSRENLKEMKTEEYPHSPPCGPYALVHTDDAYNLIMEFPDMARTKDGNNIPLKSIASKWDAYLSGTQYNFYQIFLYSYIPTGKDCFDGANMIDDIEKQDTYNVKRRSIYVKFWEVILLHVPHIKRLQEQKVKHHQALRLLMCICEELGKNSYCDHVTHYCDAITQALDNDIPEAIEAMTKYFPEAIWTTTCGSNISQYAITKRCEKVYNFLVHKLDGKNLYRNCFDKEGNNLLHLAGLLAPIEKLNLISGSALQMQRELQWFEEVKKFVHPSNWDLKNGKALTPIMVFRREHEALRQNGEAWMKKAADSYMITAALIITIAFAAAITVPCGNNSDTGKAICATQASFIIFAVSDSISLFTSTTSLLLFLSILTARYRDEDFLYRLPNRLMFGLVMLFLSVTSMIIAFSATLYLLFGEGKPWILIPIAALTCLPIASFVRLQFPLLVELISSTYGHGIFAKHSDHRNK